MPANDPKLAETRALLAEKDSLRIRTRELFNRAFQFKEKIWGDDDKFWQEAENHPVKFRARFADMTNLFSKPWAAKIMDETGQRAPERMTPEKLDDLGLTDEQIEKLATVSEDGDDPTQSR